MERRRSNPVPPDDFRGLSATRVQTKTVCVAPDEVETVHEQTSNHVAYEDLQAYLKAAGVSDEGTCLGDMVMAGALAPKVLPAPVVAVPAHLYSLTPASGGNPSQLFRDGMLIASDVEDLQVTYFFDLDDDLEVDAGESFGSAGGTAAPWELSPATSRPDPSALREVQMNLVTVTRDDDPNRDWTLGIGQATGNRTAASLSTGDGKRRRVYTARVRPRNVIS